MVTISERLLAVQDRVKCVANACHRNPYEVKLVIVSKTRSLSEVEEAAASGYFSFGENTTQDALTKIPELVDKNLEWHFIGHLQSKKSKYIPGNFQWLHTLDSIKLADKLSQAMIAHDASTPLNCLIQVNVSQEAGKSGVSPEEVEVIVKHVAANRLAGIKLRGLMTIGVNGDEEKTRSVFRILKSLCQKISKKYNLNEFDQCSMGMSGDYDIAIEEGATMLRIGTTIFGERV